VPRTTSNFADALVIINDANNKYITRKIITKHNVGKKSIEFRKGEEDIRPGARLNLLIVHSEGASVFSGRMDIVHRGLCEVALFGERPRGARSSERHPLNNDAAITAFIVNSKQESLPSPLGVTIENLSTTGVLIRTLAESLPPGVVLQIALSINGKNTVLYGKVVRGQRNDDSTYSFGCQLIFLK